MNYLDLGPAIKRIRLESGMYGSELAERMGLSPAMISTWENGHYQPRWLQVQDLCQVLGVKIEELIQMARRMRGEKV